MKWQNAKKTVTLLDESNDYMLPCIYNEITLGAYKKAYLIIVNGRSCTIALLISDK